MNLFLDRAKYSLTFSHQKTMRKPYFFQEKAFEALDKMKKQNPNGFSTMLVLPTGAGKTYTAAHWVLQNYIDKGVKVLWVAHRSELLRQAAEAFFVDTTKETLPNRESYTTCMISSEFGRSVNIGKEDLVIASRQSICSYDNLNYYVKWAKGKERKENRKLLIVFDEAHHAAASSYKKIIKTMKKYIPCVDIFGLTATPFRTAKSEQGSLKNIFSTGSGIVYSVDMNTLISCGILAKPNHIEVKTDVDMTELFDHDELRRIAKYDFSSLDEKSLEKLEKNTNRNQTIVDAYLANREKFGPTVVFAVDILNAIALNAIFQSQGVKSDFVVSSLSVGMNRSASAERNPRVIRDFKEGKIDVLINVNIVTEGTDIPNIKTVFLTRPTTSKVLMTQMVGRGLRGEGAGGTKEANIVYFIDEWRGLIDFVSPKELLSGEDCVSESDKDRKKLLRKYVELAEVEAYAVSGYVREKNISLRFNNIIPYGVIRCNYLFEDENGDESEICKELVVFDECVDIYKALLNEIPTIFKSDQAYTENQIEKIASDLFFEHCEGGNGVYIGISSDAIIAMIRTYLSSGEMPHILIFENRVSLYDLVKKCFVEGMRDQEIEKAIEEIWSMNSKVRAWYSKDYYNGLMHVYFNRMKKICLNEPRVVLPPKEKMDMGTLKKYYPEYYNELRKYLIANMKRDEEGYYYSAIQEGEEAPYRHKDLRMFEMDHIHPISAGGLTVKENLQMILRKQNIMKSNKTQ